MSTLVTQPITQGSTPRRPALAAPRASSLRRFVRVFFGRKVVIFGAAVILL